MEFRINAWNKKSYKANRRKKQVSERSESEMYGELFAEGDHCQKKKEFGRF